MPTAGKQNPSGCRACGASRLASRPSSSCSLPCPTSSRRFTASSIRSRCRCCGAGQRGAGRAHMGAARSYLAGAAARGNRRRGWQLCRNRGIDLGAMREALEQYDDSGRERGASTITQQVAKNLFFWQGRSLIRKVLEIPLAVWLTRCCRSAGCWKSTSTSPSGGRMASSAPRPAPATLSANPPAISTPAKRRNSPRSCPARPGAAPAIRAPWFVGLQAFTSAGPRTFPGSTPASVPLSEGVAPPSAVRTILL